MLLLALFLSCVVAGSLACSDDHCKDPVLANELIQVQVLPNREQLGTICPKLLTFLECEKEFMECPGRTLIEKSTSADREDRIQAKLMLGAMGLARDICDDDSSFQEEYLGNVECFRSNIEEAFSKCRDDIEKPLRNFFGQLYDEEDLNDEIDAEIRCLSDAFELACIVDNLGDACGSDARRFVMDVLERFKGVLGGGRCQDVENAADLKTSFLNFLELDEVKKSSVQGIFDLFKRRR